MSYCTCAASITSNIFKKGLIIRILNFRVLLHSLHINVRSNVSIAFIHTINVKTKMEPTSDSAISQMI